MKTCCFTGHRPRFFPWKDNLNDPKAQTLLAALWQEINLAVQEGFNHFLCGGALGVDTWAAQMVLALKAVCPWLRLTIVVPFAEYNSHIEDIRYRKTIEFADSIILAGNEKGVAGFTGRDHYMVDHSQRLIAVYDERSRVKSGTYRALEYAREQGLEIRQIRWMDMTVQG